MQPKIVGSVQIERIYPLDSLRGIASFQVFIGHYLVSVPAFYWIVYEKSDIKHDFLFYVLHSPIHFFWSASPAVIIFFVLSGFVLSLPYYSTKNINISYPLYFIKRILRLYLPLIIVMLISYCCFKILYNPYVTSDYDAWVKSMWKGLNYSKLWGFLLLNDSPLYIPSSWTLPIEIKLSLILPFFIKVQKKMNVLASILIGTILPILTTILGQAFLYDKFPEFRMMYYFTFFAIGSTLCKYRNGIIDYLNSLSTFKYYSILISALFLFTIGYNTWLIPKSFIGFASKIESFFLAVSGAIFVMYCLTSRAMALMNSRILIFFGKISFSLYLTHQLVLMVFIYLFHNYMSAGIGILLVTFPVAVFIANLYYGLVEKPTLRLNRRLSTIIKNR